jgi:hypothetical protein
MRINAKSAQVDAQRFQPDCQSECEDHIRGETPQSVPLTKIHRGMHQQLVFDERTNSMCCHAENEQEYDESDD